MEIWGIIALAITGSMMGSFMACQVWRIYYKNQGKKLGARSVCLKCGYQLRWRDNMPVVSWLMLKGRCRKCGAKIGWMELVAEVGMAIVFGLMGLKFWLEPVLIGWGNIVLLGILLIMMVIMAGLALYDAKWGEMPTKLLYASVVVGAIYAVVKQGYLLVNGELGWAKIWSFLGGVAILAGIYYLLYRVSEEKWVGGGDWILCLAISLVLGSWWLALGELLVANLLASVVMLPQLGKRRKIHFAPFLVSGLVVVLLLQKWLESLILIS